MAEEPKKEEARGADKPEEKRSPKKKKSRSKFDQALAQGMKVGSKTATFVESIKKKDVAKAIKDGFGVAKAAAPIIRTIIRAIVRRTNDKGWYIKYRSITPAKNVSRQMAARFNKSITLNPTMGSIPRFIDVEMDWADYTKSFAFDQMITNSYQLLRLKLKSNLPYTRNHLKAYIINAVSLAIGAKEIERDMAWRNYSDPDVYNFPEMFISRNNGAYGGYGVIDLVQEEYLKADAWADSITGYDRLSRLTNTNIRVPPSFALFAAHYFGSVFTDSDDGFNTQFIILRAHTLPFASYDKETDTVLVTLRDMTSISIQEFTQRVLSLGIEYGMVIADLVNSEQYVPLTMDSVTEGYQYALVYDRTLLQSLINGYTSDSAVTADGYIRMDQMSDIEDDLTQYIFMGALINQANSTGNLDAFPTLSIRSMTYKVDSDADLMWSNGLTQTGSKAQDYFTKSGIFGFSVSTDISVDTYSTVNITPTTTTGIEVRIAAENGKPATSSSTSGIVSVKGAQIGLTTTNTNITDGNVWGLSKPNNTGWAIVPPNYAPVINLNLNDGGFMNNRFYGAFVLGTVNAYDSNTALIAVIRQYSPTGEGYFPGGVTSYKTWEFAPIEGTAKTALIFLSNEAVLGLPEYTQGKFFVFPQSFNGTDAKIAYVNDASALIKPAAQLTSLVSSDTVYLYNYRDGGSQSNLSAVPYKVQSVETQISAQKLEFGITFFSSPGATTTWNIGGNGWIDATSFGYLVSVNADTPGNETVSLVDGYTQFCALMADWFDYHIPMVSTATVTTTIVVTTDSGSIVENTIDVSSEPVLVKEAYIPYYYNVKDLVPTLYDMWTSLLTPRDDIYQMLTRKQKGGSARKERERNR